MRLKKLIAAAAVGLSAFSVTGAAVAASRSEVKPISDAEVTQAVDTDHVQEGSRTSPDGAEESGSADSGSALESDSPGGHEDPAGNVDHGFEDEE